MQTLIAEIVTRYKASGYSTMMAIANAPITVTCTFCKAWRGNPCVTLGGYNYAGGYHAPRKRAIAHLSDDEALAAYATYGAEVEQAQAASVPSLTIEQLATRAAIGEAVENGGVTVDLTPGPAGKINPYTAEMREPWHRDLIIGMLADTRRPLLEWAESVAKLYSCAGSLEVTAVIWALLNEVAEAVARGEHTTPSPSLPHLAESSEGDTLRHSNELPEWERDLLERQWREDEVRRG